MAMSVNAAYGPPPSNVVPDRKSANYHPSIWGDRFLAYNISAAKTDADRIEEEHHQLLKQEVKKLLMAAGEKPGQQLMILIDEIERLGVSYHFEAEIGTLLQQMNDIFPQYCGSQTDENLHDVALCFRLLRQQGHKVSSDVFYKFKDGNGKFKELLVKDARGLLSLYEATHLRVHGEEVLEDALEFSTFQLNQHLNSNLSDPIANLVRHALKYPIRKSLTRLAARHYISIYHEFPLHNKELLRFAKVDFNLVQKLHQQEIGHISGWWKDLDFANKLSYARDRVVECYFWISGVYFEPRYSKARVFLTKVISLTSIVDDTYDVYGKVEELELFTDAIQRWDISTIDQLPEYMRLLYKPILDVFAEAEDEFTMAGKTLLGFGYAKDAFKRLTRAYLHESKWCKEGYFPTFEEYMKTALVSGAYKMLSVTSFVLMGDVATKEAFEWISDDPLIVRAASVICRLSDDIVGHEFEKKRDHIPTAVECYMKQHGLSKDTTYVELQKIIINAWKDMNQECLSPTAVPMPLLERVFNLARVINLLYDDGNDGYTHSSTGTKDMIIAILVDHVPV